MGDGWEKTSEKPEGQGAECRGCETGTGPDFVGPKRSPLETSDIK